MNAVVPTGTYAAWGWGASMKDTEIVFFSANGADSAVEFYYSVTEEPPTEEPSYAACYTTSFSQDGDTVYFSATRPLDCGTDNSYIV